MLACHPLLVLPHIYIYIYIYSNTRLILAVRSMQVDASSFYGLTNLRPSLWGYMAFFYGSKRWTHVTNSPRNREKSEDELQLHCGFVSSSCRTICINRTTVACSSIRGLKHFCEFCIKDSFNEAARRETA